MKTHYPAGIALGVVAQQVLGALWYSPLLFTNAYLAALGKTPQTYDASNPVPYIASVLCSLSVAMVISKIQANEEVECPVRGAKIGAGVALAVAIPVMAVHDLFRGTPYALIGIDAGSTLVSLAACGFVIGSVRTYVAKKTTSCSAQGAS